MTTKKRYFLNLYDPATPYLGEYPPHSSLLEFYSRINAILTEDMVLLDLGAGRGEWMDHAPSDYRRKLRDMRGKASKVIAADVDEAVLTNQSADSRLLIKNGRIDLPDQSVDIIIADWVLEHLDDPDSFAKEIRRLLKPGGYFCARTLHRLHYVALGASLIHNKLHSRIVKHAQPARKEIDVFPTRYRLNSCGKIRKAFSSYESFSYFYTPPPTYHFGRKWVFCLLEIFHRSMPRALTSHMFLFLRKPAETPDSSAP